MTTPQTPTSNETNTATAQGFAALHVVTSACHGILNTILTPPEKKPDWFDTLSNCLDATKVLAADWIDNLSPDITAKIPSHVINYGTTYAALTDSILKVLDEHPDARGKDDPFVQQVMELIATLDEEVTQIIQDVDNTQQLLKTWGGKMQIAHDNLYRGTEDIQKAQTELSAEIAKVNEAITSLQAMIDEENKCFVIGAGAVAIGITILVLGVALAVVTLGAGLVVAGIGVAAIAGGGIDMGIMKGKINTQMADIADKQQTIAVDQRQLVALQGLSLSTGSALHSVESATSALSDVRVLWQMFHDELDGTKAKLEKADAELAAIVNKSLVVAAQNEWVLAVQFAQQLVGVEIQVETQTLNLVPANA